jgi:hypothetical protein
MKPRNNKIGGCRVGAVPPDAKRRKIGRSAEKALPPKVDLLPYLTSIEEQVGSSCVANACAGPYEYLAKRNLGESADVSRLFIYFNARLECGDESEDDGTSMQAAIDGLKNTARAGKTCGLTTKITSPKNPRQKPTHTANTSKLQQFPLSIGNQSFADLRGL